MPPTPYLPDPPETDLRISCAGRFFLAAPTLSQTRHSSNHPQEQEPFVSRGPCQAHLIGSIRSLPRARAPRHLKSRPLDAPRAAICSRSLSATFRLRLASPSSPATPASQDPAAHRGNGRLTSANNALIAEKVLKYRKLNRSSSDLCGFDRS